ncbi:DNA repair protein RecO [Sporosarcina sp. P37]|uniref:DNA repair protein RecO n=1 Tax=unclassified Sporosarcina TaxID=2647733 RepID=UPI000A17DB91|nr:MULTISPECIES: DNA repair protein RecO [unclassified Sporosarcina]ARK26102.1 DNA repair protein RecO [Sporosarcina sp. P37]PID19471.1 DNA repair protein RecO [Sporosarcina sp. P35]
MLNKLEGFIIKSIPYGESNKIVTIYTREAGKITAMARGAKKPASRLAAITQTFTHGYFLVRSSRGMGSLEQGDLISSVRHIRADLETTAYAGLIVELLDRLTEPEQPNAGIFRLLEESFHAMEEGYDAEAISLFVQWKMLPVAGIHPVLHECANCGATEGEFAFSFQQIGFLCHRCFHADAYIIRLSPTQTKLIRMFYNVPLDQIGKLTLKKTTKTFMQKLVSTVYQEQTGIYLKSRKFIEQLERTPELRKTKENPEEEG